MRVGGFYHDFACLLDGDGAGANNRSDSSKITFVERSALDCAQYSTRLEGIVSKWFFIVAPLKVKYQLTIEIKVVGTI